MTLRAGFAEIDITPPMGTAKIGWLKMVIGKRVVDPIHARAAVFYGDGEPVGFVQLDTLCIRWSTAQAIRDRITRELGFPGQRVMFAATHNHAGPAVANTGDVPRDEAYLASMIDKCVQVFAEAINAAQPARIGFHHASVFGVAFNRRVVRRDGIVRTHGNFEDPLAMYTEGPMDPQLSILMAEDLQGRVLGTLVHYTCHPTHLGEGDAFSAGWPGVLAATLKKHGCPVALTLNGAAGEISTADPVTRSNTAMEKIGQVLGDKAAELIATAERQDHLTTHVSSATVELPYRNPTPDQINGTAHGAQRFIDPAIYDRHMPALLERIRTRKIQPAEVQAIFLNDLAFVSMPAELFCLSGLTIRAAAWPLHTLVVGYANGMVGYVPTRAAFDHGGYETTFIHSSRLAPQSADILVDAATQLLEARKAQTAS